MTDEIPGPYAWPLVGNLFDMQNEEGSLRALENLADIYGPVFKMTLAGRNSLFVSSAELLKLMTDEKQFIKTPPPALDGQTGPRGLFTAHSDDPDWASAHRILMPAFGPLPVEDMFPEMKDIASQMLLKWARKDVDSNVLLTEDFTRLTLDTIALCAMDYRFNSFYQDCMHPFVDAMNGVLGFSGKRSNRPAFYNKWFAGAEKEKFEKDAKTMGSISQQIIDHRRQNPTERKDLLNTMLYGKDPKDGKPMRDELIAANMNTFLIAGHETTSGLLSFVFMGLMQHPEAYLKAQAEVDEVLKGGPIQTKHLKELKYINAVLRETLRLHPTASVLSKIIPEHRRDEYVTINVGDHLYHLEPKTTLRLLLTKCQTDPAYFGEDAHQFVPERMLETNPNYSKYMQAWKPFGNGSRSCIGQNFAWQEAVMVTALVLQNFDVSLVDPNWTFHIKQNLTIKPKDLYVKIRLRKNITPSLLNARLNDKDSTNLGAELQQPLSKSSSRSSLKDGLRILYGSNSGTCQSLAQKLASTLSGRLGLEAEVADLDSAVDNLSKSVPTVIITCSYEGQPAENAARFVAWLESSTDKNLDGVRYAVFGCGHKDWKETFHRIPILIDTQLTDRGATRFNDFGSSDVSQNDVLSDFEKWQETMVGSLSKILDLSSTETTDPSSQVEIHTDKRASELSNGLLAARVTDVKILTSPGQPEKRHMEVELPLETTYECGDYLAVLPINPEALVKRMMAHWDLPWDATIVLKSKSFAPLPANTILSVYDTLRGYFELSQLATRNNIEAFKKYTDDPTTHSEIDKLLSDDARFASEIVDKQLSLFKCLLAYPKVKMPFATFLSNLMPLRVRQYSISSSPMVYRTSCTITYSVIKKPSHDSTEAFEGVATNYLASLKPGDRIQIAVKRTATANKACPFRLPPENTTPILGFCTGTGLAPLRGFIQQRAFMLEANPKLRLAPAILFVGCRSSTQDRLYAEEFDEWAKRGAVDLRYAFSQEPQNSEGCKYISDRMKKDQDEIVKIWQQGARLYVCGSRAMQESVKGARKEIVNTLLKDLNEEEQAEKSKAIAAALVERTVSDVFD